MHLFQFAAAAFFIKKKKTRTSQNIRMVNTKNKNFMSMWTTIKFIKVISSFAEV